MSYISSNFDRAEGVGDVYEEYRSAKELQEDLGLFVSGSMFEYRGKSSPAAKQRAAELVLSERTRLAEVICSDQTIRQTELLSCKVA